MSERYESANELLKKTKEYLLFDSHQPGSLMTGYDDLDQLTGGLNKGELICLAGRPSMGKTGIALGIVMDTCVEKGKTCLYFSLGSGLQFMRRLIAMKSREAICSITKENMEKECIQEAIRIIGRAPLYINQDAFSIKSIKRICRELDSKRKIDCVIVDYLQLIKCDYHKGKNDEKHILDGLKKVAKELKCPVIVLSQLNRTVEDRKDHRPRISDLRGTGLMECYFDKIMFVYRDDYYYDDSERKGIADIIVARNNTGSIGSIPLVFIQELGTFVNVVWPDDDKEEDDNILEDGQEMIVE